jgi:hypothetical protein
MKRATGIGGILFKAKDASALQADLLREIPHVRQIQGEPKRRWFTSEFLDLMVWANGENKPTGFQICHRSDDSEHAFTWHTGRGWDYARVDTGETGGLGIKASPILRPTGRPNLVLLRKVFEAAASEVPPDIRRFIQRRFALKKPKRGISKNRKPRLAAKAKRRKQARPK